MVNKNLMTCLSVTVTSILSAFMATAIYAQSTEANTLEAFKPSQVIGVIERVIVDPAYPAKDQPVGIRLLKSINLPSGTLLRAIRMRSGQNATVAELRVTTAKGKRAVAKINRVTRGVSRTVLADYPFLMAGDFVQLSPVMVKARYRVVKPVAIRYDRLYQDPGAHPLSFQLSEGGRERLKDTLKDLTRNRQSLLIVEGHTDTMGSWRRNQLESLQRAEVVKRFAVDTLGIDPDRVVAVGQGEMEPVDQTNVPGHESRNRRIVLKVTPL